MEGTVAHLLGFAYTSLILVQGSLMFTEVHRNPYWKVFLEVCASFFSFLPSETF
jgi:hypothetical protein